jgi:phosphoheptose isomerase
VPHRISWIASVLDDGARVRRDLTVEARKIADAADLVVASARAGGKVLLFGNGGSAADAQHVAAELVGRLTVDRPPIAAIALTTDTSALTAIANDYGYAHVFERQLRALGKPGDVAIAITTSGKSESIVHGVQAAREIGMRVVGLTGQKGIAFAASCDVGIVVPSTDTARIQECHITIGHMVCALVEADLCGVELSCPAPSRTSKRITLEEMLPIREELRAQKRTLVWTNGCFDVLHAGHVESLRAARKLGDALLVGVNDDDYVRRTKGEGRPIHKLDQRVAILSALEMVDFVLPFSEPTPVDVLKKLQPDVHCKGMDYSGVQIPEADIVRGYGGRIELLPMVDGLSSTSIARRLGES